MGRIEKTVFISYRRATSILWARAIFQYLTAREFDVFVDVEGLGAGDFEKIILANIRSRAHFIVILTPSSLERCTEPGDWLRREIETAMLERRNIVPVMVDNFDFGSPATREALTGKLALLRKYNGLRIYADYFDEGLERLQNRFLNLPLDNIPLPELPREAEAATELQQTSATAAPQVQPEEFTAQEWFERGYTFDKAGSLDEAIRCYSEAIALQPDHLWAYNHRGCVRQDQGDLEGALADYTETVRLKPDFAQGLRNRARVYWQMGQLETARQEYVHALDLEPHNYIAHAALTGVLKQLGEEAEAREQEHAARELFPKVNEYNQAWFEALCGNREKALDLLQTGLEKGQMPKPWAAKDAFFESFRGDPRFDDLVK